MRGLRSGLAFVLALLGGALLFAHAQAAGAPAVLVAPVEIPEPITIILFGTGLAALVAATVWRR